MPPRYTYDVSLVELRRPRLFSSAPAAVHHDHALADPADKFPIQLVGPIHVHPNGRFVYLGNRSGVAGGSVG
jgi:hypothetical protein